MKKYSKSALYLVFATSAIFIACTFYDNFTKEKNIQHSLVNVLINGHYDQRSVDDVLSERVYDLFIDRLDVYKRYFVKTDIENFEKHKRRIDDQIKTGEFEFYTLVSNTFQERYNFVKNNYKAYLEKPFDFEVEEELETDPDKSQFANDTMALKDLWRRYIKYQCLSRIVDQMNIQEKAIEKKDTSVKIKTFEEIEKDVRGKVSKTMEEYFKNMDKISNDDKVEFYFNCIANAYDPHTEYYSFKEKEQFDIQMSGKLEGIGATLQVKDSYVKIAELVPGGPAWLQGKLKAGDLIMKVAQGSNEPVDIADMRLDDVVKLVRGKKGSEVRLTVKHADGSISVISIIRDVVMIEETFAKSVILQAPNSKEKIGYIYLPKFYADFNDRNGRTCSKDMKIEIEKLKKENVDGMIIDLRNNGGGSLGDVVKIAGFFVPSGPIVQVKTRWGKADVYNDEFDNNTTLYDGPLAVMVNSNSASASEILAAALQDYKRAIIVGDSSTFGKGTVQRILDLDNAMSMFNDKNVKQLGSLKLTFQKFYRIDGGSTQLRGVYSDIVFPDSYSSVRMGEKNQEYYIPWDEIPSAKYTVWDNKYNKKLENIKQSSKKRIAKCEDFALIKENAVRIKNQKENSKYSLNLKKYKERSKNEQEIAKKYENIFKNDIELNITAIRDHAKDLKADSMQTIKSDAWVKKLKKDIYLQETYNIVKDFMNYN